jgi:hypothetical protein
MSRCSTYEYAQWPVSSSGCRWQHRTKILLSLAQLYQMLTGSIVYAAWADSHSLVSLQGMSRACPSPEQGHRLKSNLAGLLGLLCLLFLGIPYWAECRPLDVGVLDASATSFGYLVGCGAQPVPCRMCHVICSCIVFCLTFAHLQHPCLGRIGCLH